MTYNSKVNLLFFHSVMGNKSMAITRTEKQYWMSSCAPKTQLEQAHSCVKCWYFKILRAMCVDSGLTFWRFRYWVFVRIQPPPGQVVFETDVWSQNNRFYGLITQKVRNQFKRLLVVVSAFGYHPLGYLEL